MEKEDYNNKLYLKALNGNLSEQEQLLLEEWLKESDENLTNFQRDKKIWELTVFLKKHDLNIARLKTETKILQKQKTKKDFVYYWQKAAAILLLPVLIASAYLYQTSKDKTNFTIVNTSTETVTTPYGARTSLTLPDGSVVWLNAGSEISYPHKFTNIREVNLKGEMYLEVTKNNTPFIVKTQYGNVKVLGTKFDVCAYNKEEFTTTLLEGSVVITGKKPDNELVKLEPGYQAILRNGKYEKNKVEVDQIIAWKDGRMEFRREPFELVAKKLERWFNVTIELKGEKIKELWYTGTIEMESFSEVLELIKNTTPIEYSFNSKTRILTIERK